MGTARTGGIIDALVGSSLPGECKSSWPGYQLRLILLIRSEPTALQLWQARESPRRNRYLILDFLGRYVQASYLL
jgi:hypothetical protein